MRFLTRLLQAPSTSPVATGARCNCHIHGDRENAYFRLPDLYHQSFELPIQPASRISRLNRKDLDVLLSVFSSLFIWLYQISPQIALRIRHLPSQCAGDFSGLQYRPFSHVGKSFCCENLHHPSIGRSLGDAEKGFPMNSHPPRDSRHRDGRILVTRDSADAVRTIHRQIGTFDHLARATNPDAIPPASPGSTAPPITAPTGSFAVCGANSVAISAIRRLPG